MKLNIEYVGSRGEKVAVGKGQAVVSIDGVPAFILLEGGRKEPLTPSGWNTYRNNVMDIEHWLERRKHPSQSPSGQLG